ncbi:hypothetical protein JDW21_18775 [Bacillus subtilis]|uniref:hypothetical protein n=1 Tax=Bacillus subtilis TaxID=1423 RepID=UPI002ED22E12
MTTDESLDSILKNGLKPLIGERSIKIENIPAIYLFPNIDYLTDALYGWLGDEFEDYNGNLHTLKINLPESFQVENTCEYEVCSYNPIPSKYISYLRKEDF